MENNGGMYELRLLISNELLTLAMKVAPKDYKVKIAEILQPFFKEQLESNVR